MRRERETQQDKHSAYSSFQSFGLKNGSTGIEEQSFPFRLFQLSEKKLIWEETLLGRLSCKHSGTKFILLAKKLDGMKGQKRYQC